MDGGKKHRRDSASVSLALKYEKLLAGENGRRLIAYRALFVLMQQED